MAKLSENKIILTFIIIVVIVGSVWGILFGIDKYNEHTKLTTPQKAEDFFYQNKDVLNEFVELCFEYDINYIGTQEYSRLTSTEYKIKGFYVYIFNDINEDIKEELSVILELFDENNITNVYIDVKNHQHVSIVMSVFFASAAIKYYTTPQTIEEIKEDNYTDQAWFVDENWVIIVGEFL